MKKFVSKIALLALVVGLFFGYSASWLTQNVLAAAPNGTMTSTPLTVPTGGTPKAINPITVTDSGSEITATNDIRIKIPAGVNATWDYTDTTAIIAGGAGSGVVNTSVTYADSNKTLILNVTTSFTASQWVTISGLSLIGGSSATIATALQWSVDAGANYGTGDSSTQITVSKDIATSTDVGNVSPVITVTPSDGGSVAASPTNVGSTVTFTAKAIDMNSDDYYLAICKTNAITAGATGPNYYPTCTGGKWPNANPTAFNSDVLAGETYTVNSDYTTGTASFDGTTTVIGSGTTWTATMVGRQIRNNANGTWFTITAWASGTSLTINTTPGTYSGAYTITESQVNPWYAFVCDKTSSSSCFPASGNGDQGRAIGTVTFSNVPADGNAITVDGKVYEFNITGNCAGGETEDVCVDVTAALNGADAAAALAAAETGVSTTMTARGSVAYVYAISAGSGGNSIGMSITTCPNCTLSGSLLSGGNDSNESPFIVNHAPTFDATQTLITDASLGSLQPGETVRLTLPNAAMDDIDNDDSQDTVTVYFCSGESDMGGVTDHFNYTLNQCEDSSNVQTATLCSVAGVNPTSSSAQCDDTTNMISVPTAHATNYTVMVYIKDSHNFPGVATAGNSKDFEVTDVDPVLTSYAVTDDFSPTGLPAGGSDTVTYTVSLYDDNGAYDVTAVEGWLFDANFVTISSGVCAEDENECYKTASCSLAQEGATGSGKTAKGTDKDLLATCNATVYYNANASTNWEVRGNPTDESKKTNFIDSTLNRVNLALSAINVKDPPTIAYGSLALNAISSLKTTRMQNYGNQSLDVQIQGTAMAKNGGGDSIPANKQKWSNTIPDNGSTDFNYGGATANTLVIDASGSSTKATGCADRDMVVRGFGTTEDHHSTLVDQTEDENMYWKIQIPSSVLAGTYTGTNTFFAASASQCADGE